MDSVSDQRPERSTIAPLVMKWSVFLAAAGVVVYLCLLILRPFFGVVAWSAVLAITCYPVHQRLVRRNGRVALSAAITSTLMVLAVLVPLLLIGGVAVKQLLAVGDSLRQAFLDPAGLSRRVTAALAPLTQRLGLDPDAIVAWVSAHASEWVARAGQHTMSAAAGVGGALAVLLARLRLWRFGRGPAAAGDAAVELRAAAWRFLGFAYDQQLRSGYLEDKAVTAKDLMVQPNPPRFLREGDVLEFTAKVSNQSAARQEGKVKYLGFSAHTTKAALQALRGFAFDTVMFPINFVEYYNRDFGRDVLALAEEQGAAVLAIERADGAPPFRLFNVQARGVLFADLALRHREAHGFEQELVPTPVALDHPAPEEEHAQREASPEDSPAEMLEALFGSCLCKVFITPFETAQYWRHHDTPATWLEYPE